VSTASIPNRPAFRAQEVCEIASVQPYVLRGWEAEFPDLGVAKVPNGPRVYRRADVERVLRLKHLIQVEGLTLSGARRRLEEEAAPDLFDVGANGADGVGNPEGVVAPVADHQVRAHLQEVRQGLQWILETLETSRVDTFELAAVTGKARKSAGRKVAK